MSTYNIMFSLRNKKFISDTHSYPDQCIQNSVIMNCVIRRLLYTYNGQHKKQKFYYNAVSVQSE